MVCEKQFIACLANLTEYSVVEHIIQCQCLSYHAVLLPLCVCVCLHVLSVLLSCSKSDFVHDVSVQ